MNSFKLKDILKIIFIDKKSTRYSILLFLITNILIPIDFLCLWMISNFTKFLSTEDQINFYETNSSFLFWIQIKNFQSYGILLLFLLFVTFCLKYYQFYLSHFISSYIDAIVSNKSFKKILNLRISSTDDNNTSKYLSDLRSLCDVKAGVILPFLQIFYSLISSTVILIGLLYLSNIYILIFGSLIIICYLLLTFVLTPKMKRISKDLSIRFRKIYTVPNYACRDLINIRLYDQEDFLYKLFKKEYNLLKKIDLQRSIISGSPKLILEWVIFSSFIGIILVLNNLGNQLQILSGFSLYLYALLKIIPSLQLAYTSFTTLTTNWFLIKSINNFEKIVPYKRKISLEKNSIKLTQILKKKDTRLSIEIQSFTKSYGNKQIFSNLNLKFPEKGIYQFVGKSGCGKSTLMRCIAGLDLEYQGKIKIFLNDSYDKTTLNQFDVKPSLWHSQISYVPQSIILKNDTLISNIAFGRDVHALNTKEKKRIDEAVEKANLKEFINSLPEGLYTKVNQYGGSLSGGQIQRIAIARAFFKASPLMLLDEATSALDSLSEKYILNSLKEHSKKCLIIFITHRDSSLITNNIIRIE
tara:strand:- start:29891 stop:31639 length:1749 start_codon:yes stop_codon:yes gene_type:complete